MNLEKELAERTIKAIKIKDNRSAERFYNHYLYYTRKILPEFDIDLQDKVMFKYAEYVTRDIK